MAETYDLVVIGAGAAGLFCAGTAAQRGKRVCVLEHGAEPGRKILISGGGRCNFTNLEVTAKNFLSANPHFAKSALAQFKPADFIKLVEGQGISYHEKTLGQLFCDGPSEQILRLLLARMSPAVLKLSCEIQDVSHDGGFCLRTSQGEIRAPRLVIATGGLSIPKLGATGFAYALAKKFGLGVVAPVPALVPLTFAPQELAWMSPLAGLSVPARVSAGKVSFDEAVLFTHRGLSGPAVLQISSYLTAKTHIKPQSATLPPEKLWFCVDFCPDVRFFEHLPALKRARARIGLKTALSAHLPARLAAHFAAGDERNLADIPDRHLIALGEGLNRCPLTATGTEGFVKAEVTAGGVSTADLASKDCQAKTVPGLYVIGEAVDVTGWLGGYNFQWAWASGWAAGASAAQA
ncbi:aminoacetone oxidase family FAD-binding enzyme [Acidocella sp.]|uniref:NAD(P)/FAD-dependent oxidoreductase n=1 Tax=Acidocella sp. TaxID=50710 RepID=UPI0026130432|nr:aminoacetone oxidase family FAD-binding enzyme [Acidocella sp.]